jgi:hypothetical protein
MVSAIIVPAGILRILTVPGNVVRRDLVFIMMVYAINANRGFMFLLQVAGNVVRTDIPIIMTGSATTVRAGIIPGLQVAGNVVLKGTPIIVTDIAGPGLAAAAAIPTTTETHIPIALRIPALRVPIAIRKRSNIDIKYAMTGKFGLIRNNSELV